MPIIQKIGEIMYYNITLLYKICYNWLSDILQVISLIISTVIAIGVIALLFNMLLEHYFHA